MMTDKSLADRIREAPTLEDAIREVLEDPELSAALEKEEHLEPRLPDSQT